MVGFKVLVSTTLVLLGSTCSRDSKFGSTGIKAKPPTEVAPSETNTANKVPSVQSDSAQSANSTGAPVVNGENVVTPTPTPQPETPSQKPIVTVNLGSCARNAGCLLRGTKFGTLTANLATSKEVFAVDETITMRYAGLRGVSSDWITVVPADFEDNSWCAWFWSGDTAGTYDFNGLPAGKYELRAYYGWRPEGECEVIGRKTFEVK